MSNWDDATYAPGEWEAQEEAWRALISDPVRLRELVAVLREHGLRLTESGGLRVTDE